MLRERLDRAVGIVVQRRQADAALVRRRALDVIEQVPLAAKLDDGAVHVARAVVEDHALVLEGTERAAGDAVFQEIGHPVAAGRRIAEIVEAGAFVHPDALVILGHRQDRDAAVAGDHVGLQLHDAEFAAAAEIEIGLAVVVDEDAGIDDKDAGLALADERPAERVLERARGRVGHGHADLLVGGEIKIIPAVALDAVGRPGVALRPRDVPQAEDDAVILPRDEVVRGKHMPVHHVPVLAPGEVVRRIDIDAAGEDPRGRVGLEIGQDLPLGRRGREGQDEGKKQAG